MNAIEVLKNDHQRVRDLFFRFGEATSIQQKERLSNQIFNELTIHTLVEEALFYPLIEETEPDMIDEAMDEHDTVDDLIEELKEMRLDVPEFEIKIADLRAAVAHHVEEEEREMFPLAQREHASRLEGIGEQMQDMKGRAQAAA